MQKRERGNSKGGNNGAAAVRMEPAMAETAVELVLVAKVSLVAVAAMIVTTQAVINSVKETEVTAEGVDAL
jgi:hypothetical protein